MRIVRSWPATIPVDRPHVVDQLPRLQLADFDYTPLGDIADDVLLLEWDMAVSLGDLERFARRAAETPGRVLVAPYPLYHVGPYPVQAHRRVTGPGPEDTRPVRVNEPTADLFGLGMAYLPRPLILEFLRWPSPARGQWPFERGYTDGRFTDQTFSVWHFHNAACGPVAIDWSVRPVHLHYSLHYIGAAAQISQ